MRTVAEIARLFDVEKDTVKNWCYRFADYLSPSATARGKTRLFDDTDLRVLALIYYYWEDNPDYEHIRSLLSSMEYNNEEFLEFGELNTSIFKNASEYDYEGEEAWKRGILIADDTMIFSQIEIARSYKRAADALVNIVQNSCDPCNLAYPIFYTYRHSLELYLKTLSQHNHDTDSEKHYLDKLINTIETKYNEKFPMWMRDRLLEFHSIDPASTAFRYLEGSMGIITGRDEIWIDFTHLQFVMDRLCGIFENVITKLNMR
jgi:DNA-binding transcriptional MerR regulator